MSAAFTEIQSDSIVPANVYRDYSPEFKAEALARLKANDGNVYRTAMELNIPRQTLDSWAKDYGDRYSDLQQRKQIELATKYEASLHRTADAMMDDDLSKVSYVQKATAIGILTDKMLLLRGQPTSIVATQNDHSELLQSVATLAQEQRLTEHEAALKLAAQLSDVPELAAMLREWAAQEQVKQNQQLNSPK